MGPSLSSLGPTQGDGVGLDWSQNLLDGRV